jgi:methyl-accepting chemotaxis protein
LIHFAWKQLLKPLRDVINKNVNTQNNLISGLNFSFVSITQNLEKLLHTAMQKNEESIAFYERSHNTIAAIEADVRALDSYTEHMVAVDEELGFQPELIENAFNQSVSAADYATSTFEQIYMSISGLGDGYNGVRSQSVILQESAQTAGVQVSATKDNVTKLSVAASEINEVTKSISDIASMTQLLALNASIEAARAGESGRGFAVVADEVKKLAGQTDKATRRISEISNGILSSSRESEESIEKINELTQDINNIISAVFSDIESQWDDVQNLLGKMGQAAGTVSGLKGILMSSETELKSHFVMLEGVYQFAKESSKTVKNLSMHLNLPSQTTQAGSDEDESIHTSENTDLTDKINTEALTN